MDKKLVKSTKLVNKYKLNQKEDLVFAWKLAIYYHLGNSLGMWKKCYRPNGGEIFFIYSCGLVKGIHQPHDNDQTFEDFKEASSFIKKLLSHIFNKRNKGKDQLCGHKLSLLA